MLSRKAIIILSITAVALGAAAVYSFFDPASSQFFPKCAFYHLTGYKCPGCGTQRALHALLHHGDLALAWHYNAGLMVAMPLIVLYGATDIFRHRWRSLWLAVNHPAAIVVLILAVIAWWVGRNIAGI